MHLSKNNTSLLHIKGHQDDSAPYEDLPFIAQLNCVCDRLAKTFLLSSPRGFSPRSYYPFLPHSNITIQNRNKIIVSNIEETLVDAYNRKNGYLTLKNTSPSLYPY